jgi:hypothetical protein
MVSALKIGKTLSDKAKKLMSTKGKTSLVEKADLAKLKYKFLKIDEKIENTADLPGEITMKHADRVKRVFEKSMGNKALNTFKRITRS